MLGSLRITDSRIVLVAAMILFSTSCAAHTEPGASAADLHASESSDSDERPPLFGEGQVTDDLAFEARVATGLREHTTAGEGADLDPTVDPTGETLLFASTRFSKNSHLFTKPIDGTTVTQLTDGDANEAMPAFSANGQYIAYCTDRDGQWDIWVMDADGRNARRITDDPLPEYHPSWSPDGQRIAYCRMNVAENRGEIWIAEVHEPGVHEVIGEGLYPAWSPSGDLIAYQRPPGRGNRWSSIWTLHVDEKEALLPTEVASSPDAAFISPSWSPDGEQIAFAWIQMTGSEGDKTASASSDIVRADIGMVDATGEGLTRLTDGRAEHGSPHWAKDGRLYFTARNGDGQTIWSLKPFRPPVVDDLPPPLRNRRAAQLNERVE